MRERFRRFREKIKASLRTRKGRRRAVIAAIVPILGSLVTDFFQQTSNSTSDAFRNVTLTIFLLGMAYLLACGVWAFRPCDVWFIVIAHSSFSNPVSGYPQPMP